MASTRSLVNRLRAHPARGPLALLLVARLAMGFTYALLVPVWEAYDEDGHFAYVRYLARYGRLLQPGDPEAESIWEKFQPPLYYALMAPTVAWLDLGERFPDRNLNPFFQSGEAGVNYALHPPRLAGLEARLALGALIVRLAGVVVTTSGVVPVWLVARRLWPGARGAITSTAWLATLVYAFWPQLLFVGSMVTNDLLVTALTAAWFYPTMRLTLDGFRLRWVAAAGALLGLALLTKLNALALVPATLAALTVALAREARAGGRPSRTAGRRGPARQWLTLAGVGAIALLALWLLARLEFVSSQVLSSQTLRSLLGSLSDLPAAPPVARTGQGFTAYALEYGFRTFIASYGWGNLEGFSWLYPAWSAGAGLAAAGLLLAAWRGRHARPPEAGRGGLRSAAFAVMGLQAASVVGVALALAIAHQSAFLVPGRYLLPALPAIVILLVRGWEALLPGGRQRRAWQLMALGLVLAGWLTPLVVLYPAYAYPQPYAGAIDVPVGARFGEAVELVGYQSPAAVVPGQPARVTLCWRGLAPIAADYPVRLDVVGPDGQGYGRLATFPGRGNFPTSFWTPGETICDDYTLGTGQALAAPSLARLEVRLLETNDLNGPRVPLANGDETVSIPLHVRHGQEPAALPERTRIRFGDRLLLRGYEIEPAAGAQTVIVRLEWEALADVGGDYSVFVHLRDTPTSAVAISQSQPRQGTYPTWLWAKGEVVIDEHVLTGPAGPAGSLALVVGVTDGDERLPATDAQGEPLRDDEAWLAQDLTLPR